MVFRFADQFSSYWSHGPFNNPGSYTESEIISRGLLLDLCPFCGFFMPILLMVDPTRKAAKVLAPTSFLAGLTTILSLAGDRDAVLTAQYIFIGVSPNPCYFIMHFLQIVLAVGVILNTGKYTWKGYLWGIGCTLSIYAYVGFARLATGASWFVSGLSYNDWSSTGEYHAVAEILHWNPKVCPYICLPIMWAIGSSECAVKDYLMHRGWFWYGNARNNRVVTFKLGKKQIKMKQWWFWYNYDKEVPVRIL